MVKPVRNHRLFCFDLDGTLVENFLIETPEGLRPDPKQTYELPLLRRGVETMIRVLARRGAEFALVTNQGGVAFGHQTEEQVGQRIGVALARLHWCDARPLSVHVCYTHPQATVEAFRAEDERRKPGPGMIYEAMTEHEAWPGETLMIGDLNTDYLAARAAKIGYRDINEFMRELGVGPRRPGVELKSGASSPQAADKTKQPSA